MANQFLYANFFATELLASVGVSDTILQIPPAAAQQLQNFSSGFYAPMALWDGSNPPEIVYVTNNPQTGAMTVLRAQESTSAFGWSAGTQMISSLTAGVINAALQAYNTGLILIANYLPLNGGTLTGPLILSGPPTVALGAATKAYVDALGTGPFLPLGGGTLTGSLSMNTNRILSLPTPSTGTEPATKAYADNITLALTNFEANISGQYVSGGTGAAYTVATLGGQFAGGLTDGTKLAFRLSATSQTAPTLAVDGTAAVPLRIQTGTNLQAGVLATGTIVMAEYHAAVPEWLIQDIQPTAYLTTTGGPLAYSLTSGLSILSLQDGIQLYIIINVANNGPSTLNVDGLGAIPLRPSSGVDFGAGALPQYSTIALRYNAATTEFLLVGAPTVGPAPVRNLPFSPVNAQLSASVVSNILTVNLLTGNGATPSVANPVQIPFADNTVTNGDPVWISAVVATSISTVVGASLGSSNGVPFRLWVVAFNNAGVVTLALINCSTAAGIFPLDVNTPQNTTVMGAGATSPGVFYTGLGSLTNVSFVILGYIEYNAGLVTAGTYNNPPTAVRLFGSGSKKPGDILQSKYITSTAQTTVNSTTKTLTGLTGTITPASPVNLVRARASGYTTVNVAGAANTNAVIYQLFRGAAAVALGSFSVQQCTGSTNATMPVICEALDQPGVATPPLTYSLYGFTSTGTNSNVFLSTANSVTGGTGVLTLEEIMG